MRPGAAIQLVRATWRRVEPRLVPNWRRAHRMISVQCMALAGALQSAWLFVPDDLRMQLGPDVGRWVGYAVLVLAFVGAGGRLVSQQSCRCPNEERGQ